MNYSIDSSLFSFSLSLSLSLSLFPFLLFPLSTLYFFHFLHCTFARLDAVQFLLLSFLFFSSIDDLFFHATHKFHSLTSQPLTQIEIKSLLFNCFFFCSFIVNDIVRASPIFSVGEYYWSKYFSFISLFSAFLLSTNPIFVSFKVTLS